MNDLIVVERPAEWKRLKALVLDSVSSPITRRVYNMVLDEFMDWFKQAPRPGFTKAGESGRRRSRFRGERDQRSGMIPITVPD